MNAATTGKQLPPPLLCGFLHTGLSLNTCSDPPAPLSHRDSKSHCSILCHHFPAPFLHSTSQMPDVIRGSYQPVVQRYLPRLLPYTVVVPAVTGTPRTLDACLPPGAVISTHISVRMGGLPAAEALWCSRASGSYLQDPVPGAVPCTASFDSCAAALPLPGATQYLLSQGQGTSCYPSPTTAVPASMSSSQLLLFSPSSHSQESTHRAD